MRATCLQSWFNCMMFHHTLTVLCPSVANHLMHVATGVQLQHLKYFRLGRKVLYLSCLFSMHYKVANLFFFFVLFVLNLGQVVHLLSWCIGGDESLNFCIILWSLYSKVILLSLCKMPSCVSLLEYIY